jgi:hypothetical protein
MTGLFFVTTEQRNTLALTVAHNKRYTNFMAIYKKKQFVTTHKTAL